MILTGRHAIITGASQGLGAKIAEHYVAAGASVLLCARTMADLEKVRGELLRNGGSSQKILIMKADISIPAEVDRMIEKSLLEFSHVDILVNNAGVYGPIGALEDNNWDDWEHSIKINLLGPAYTCRALLPYFRKRGYGKIVNVSGGGATNPLPRLSSYAASKAGLVRFTETLALEVMGSGIDVNAVAPGALATRMLDEVLSSGPESVGEDFHRRMTKIKAEGGTPLELGASLCVYLGSSESDGISGKLISAPWDPWQEFQSHRAELADSDIYTLRRIVPKDRNLDWD